MIRPIVPTVAALAAGSAFLLAGCGSQYAALGKPAPAVTVTHTATATPKPMAHKTATAPPAPAPAAALPSVIDVNGQSSVEPTQIALSADGNGWLQGLSWSSWTANGAEGSGYINVNNCQPDCAQGTITNVNVSVSMSDPTGGPNPYYTEMTAQDASGNENTYSAGSNGSMEVTSDALYIADEAPGSSAGSSGDQYAQDIWNAGISAPQAWIDSTGQTLCADWNNGETTADTDSILRAGGIYRQHLVTYDAITAQDLCPDTPGGP